ISQVRDSVASFTRAARESATLAVDLIAVLKHGELTADLAAQAATEGAVLARYRYDELKRDAKTVQLEKLTLVVADDESSDAEAAEIGVERGLILSRTAALARDLGNTPPRHLSAVKFADL